MIAAFGVPSWDVSTIRRLGVMTTLAPEPDPDRTERASDAVVGGTDRSAPAPGGLRLVSAAGCDGPGGVGAGRRLRTAPPVQLELVSGREGPRLRLTSRQRYRRVVMQFEQQAQEDLYARVATYLRQAFGELAEPLEDETAFRLALGRVPLLITVDANGPERASVLMMRRLAIGLPITPDLATFLLRKNHEVPFGALMLDDEQNIVFRHILLGESVNKEALFMLVRLLACYADEIEDELNMRFR